MTPFERACDGERDAIIEHLEGCGVDPRIVRHIASWHRGRQAKEEDFEANVAARLHYLMGSALGRDKEEVINEMTDRFGLPPNRARHLANGNGYAPVREEALRRYRASLQTD